MTVSIITCTSEFTTIELTIDKWSSVVHTAPYCCTFCSSNKVGQVVVVYSTQSENFTLITVSVILLIVVQIVSEILYSSTDTKYLLQR